MRALLSSKKHALTLAFLVLVVADNWIAAALSKAPLQASVVGTLGLAVGICVGGQAAIDHKSAGNPQ